MYRYEFTSTIRDLLDAEDAEMTEMTCRPFYRWVLAVLGLIPIVQAVQDVASLELGWGTLVMSTLGVLVIYHFVGRSLVRRRRIRRGNAPSVEVVAEFGDDCLRFDASDYGAYTREWRELVQFVNASRGVLLYFADDTVNWLPNRVFRDKAEKKAFVEFVRSHAGREARSSLG